MLIDGGEIENILNNLVWFCSSKLQAIFLFTMWSILEGHSWGNDFSVKSYQNERTAKIMDPNLYQQMMNHVDYTFVVFYRWLLLDFKRGTNYKNVDAWLGLDLDSNLELRTNLSRSVQALGSGMGCWANLFNEFPNIFRAGIAHSLQGDYNWYFSIYFASISKFI